MFQKIVCVSNAHVTPRLCKELYILCQSSRVKKEKKEGKWLYRILLSVKVEDRRDILAHVKGMLSMINPFLGGCWSMCFSKGSVEV